MTDLSVRVSGGFGTEYPDMSPSLRARVAQSDAEFERQAARDERERRVAAELRHERAVDAAVWQLAQEAGIPLTQARREVGHTVPEFLSIASARQDLEDAQRRDRQRQALRRAGIDPDSGEPVELRQPSELAVAGAARTMRDGDDPVSVGKGVRAKWLRRNYRRME
jgi:hypothetical protein